MLTAVVIDSLLMSNIVNINSLVEIYKLLLCQSRLTPFVHLIERKKQVRTFDKDSDFAPHVPDSAVL